MPKRAVGADLAIRKFDPLIVWAADYPIGHDHVLNTVQPEELANLPSYLRICANIIFLPVSKLRPGVGCVDYTGDDAVAVMVVRTIICQGADRVALLGFKDLQELFRKLSRFWHRKFSSGIVAFSRCESQRQFYSTGLTLDTSPIDAIIPTEFWDGKKLASWFARKVCANDETIMDLDIIIASDFR